MTRKSTLLAIALGLSAFGSTTMPAAALPGRIFFGASPIMIPHFGGGIPSRIIRNFDGPLRLPVQLPQRPMGQTIGDLNTKPAQLPEPQPPFGAKTIGDLGMKPAQLPMPPSINPHPIDDVCPDNPFKCPKNAGGGTGGSAGAGGTGGTNPPTGGSKGGPVVQYPPVIVPTPPIMVQAPVAMQAPPIVTRPQPVAAAQPVAAQAPAASNTAAAAPCNCLTKQYLDDGSVVFRDLCTREAAMATQAELQAQNQAAAR
jgi:hypothetical protein